MGLLQQRLIKFFSLSLFFALSGCMTVHQNAAQAHYSGAIMGQALPLEVNEFVTAMPAGSVAVFPQTPWGKQLEVELYDKYFSASGRDCRALKLRSASTTLDHDRALVCQFELGQWQSVRPVTQVLK